MACDSDALMSCNNWLAIFIYILITASVVLLLLLCFGMCRNYWQTKMANKRRGDPQYWADNMKFEPDDVSQGDVSTISGSGAAVVRNPHALYTEPSPDENNHDVLPPYKPPSSSRASSTTASSSKPQHLSMEYSSAV